MTKCFSLEEMVACLSAKNDLHNVTVESWTAKSKGILIEYKMTKKGVTAPFDGHRVAFFEGTAGRGFSYIWDMNC